MTWLIVFGSILGGLIGLVAIVMIVGRFLPEHYQCRVETTFDHPPEKVWAAMMDYRKHPLTGSMMKRIEDRPAKDGLPVWLEDMGASQVTVTTVVSDPPKHLVRELVDSVVPMTARNETQLERTDRGCKATTTHAIHIRAGTWHVPFFRVILTLTKGARSSIRKYWEKIAAGLK